MERAEDKQSLHKQLLILTHESRRAVHAIDQAGADLQKLEDEMADFLERYYAKVGPYVAELEQLETELQQWSKPGKRFMAERVIGEAISEKKHQKHHRAQLKKLYRELAQQLHPDKMLTATGSEQQMAQLNAAYANGSAAHLWKMALQQDLKDYERSGQSRQMVEQLKKRLSEMEAARAELQAQREALFAHSAYALMQREFQLRLCGVDMTAQIMEQLESRIIAQRKALLSHKMQGLTAAAS